MTIASRATEKGTAELREAACNRLELRSSFSHFRRAGELWLSSLGLSVESAGGGELAAQAIEYGCNVLQAPLADRQAAQSALGRALADGIAEQRFTREQIVVTALGGMMAELEPLSFGGRLARIEDHYLAHELVAWADLTPTLHCLAPRFLRDEASRANQALGLETIDLYLLDRPELHLLHLPPALFAARMRDAFAAMEQLCSDGRIAAFGITTAPSPTQPPLDVRALVGWAREVGGERHHLRVLQVPLGLSAPGPILDVTQPLDGGNVSLLAAAARLGLYTIAVHQPLDGGNVSLLAAARLGLYTIAVHQPLGGAALPPFYRGELVGLATDEQRALQFTRSAPGVTTAMARATDMSALSELAEVGRIPPAAAETTRALLEATRG